MDIIIEWLSKYSWPVVTVLVLGAAFLFLIKYITEKALDNKFKQYETELTLRLERRSRFEEKLLLDQYLLVTELFHKINRVATDLNRHRRGITVEGLLNKGDIVPLTQVYEELSSKRYLLGHRFHDVLSRLSAVVLKIAQDSGAASKQLEAEYLSLIDEFNRIATQEFGIESIQRGFGNTGTAPK